MSAFTIVVIVVLGFALVLALGARMSDARAAADKREELRRARNALAAMSARAERAEAELGRATEDALERLSAEQVHRRRAEAQLHVAQARLAELEAAPPSADGRFGRRAATPDVA